MINTYSDHCLFSMCQPLSYKNKVDILNRPHQPSWIGIIKLSHNNINNLTFIYTYCLTDHIYTNNVQNNQNTMTNQINEANQIIYDVNIKKYIRAISNRTGSSLCRHNLKLRRIYIWHHNVSTVQYWNVFHKNIYD